MRYQRYIKEVKQNINWPDKPDYFNPIVKMYFDTCIQLFCFELHSGEQTDEKIDK